MFGILVTATALVLGQTNRTSPSASEMEQRAVEAAERAAAAAQSAAESAAKAAAAAERIAHQVAPAAPAEPAKKAPSGWSGTIGVGLISVTGNATTITFNANVAVEKKLEEWIFAGKASGVYGRSKLPGQSDSQLVALAAGTQLRIDRLVSSWVTVYVLGGIETDHIKSLEAREYGEGGTGLIWVNVKQGDLQKALLRTDIAFRYSYETRFQYFPAPTQNLGSVTLVAPRFGAAFRYALSPEIKFQEDAEILPNVSGESRFLVNSTTKLSSKLTETFALGVSFVVSYDSTPAVGKLPTDTALGLTLDASF